MKPEILWIGTIPDNAPEYHDRIQYELSSLDIDDWENLYIHIVPLSHSSEGPVIVISGMAADKVTAEYRDCLVWDEVDISGSDLANKTGKQIAFVPRLGDN